MGALNVLRDDGNALGNGFEGPQKKMGQARADSLAGVDVPLSGALNPVGTAEGFDWTRPKT